MVRIGSQRRDMQIKHLISIPFITLFLSILTLAGGPQVWSVNSREQMLKGDARGISIDQNGSIALSPKLVEVFRTGQPYIWSSAVDAAGNTYLGTGSGGKIFKVSANGSAAEFADLTEMNVTAIVIGRSGEIFAATSPDGKVYRIDAVGKAEIYFEPGEKYIWALTVLPDGLAVATGDNGKIFKVKAAGVAPDASLLYDTTETHIITLAADKQGTLYAGTDPGGIVMRFGPDGKPFGMLDSPLREIHDLAVAADGSVYALALSESVSSAKPDAAKSDTASSKPVSIEKKPPVEAPAKSLYDLKDAKSAVYRIYPDGGSDLLWASPTVVGFSICKAADGDGVFIGTSDKGRIYTVTNSGREILTLQSDAGQISTIKSDGRGFIATSSNQGSLYRIGPDTVAEGTYSSSVLDAKAGANWGRIWWRSTGNVSLQTRAGNTETPDETWSSWSSALTDAKGGAIASPKARYLQWRAVLRPALANSSERTSLAEVSVGFTPRNLAPEVRSLSILPTNIGLAENPKPQIDPNIALSGMDPIDFGLPKAVVPPRRIYQRGAVALQWTADDRNGDELTYDVYYREIGGGEFRLLKSGLTDPFFTIDGQSLADGRYIFRVVASDAASNPIPLALTGERLSEPVDIDNTPPIVTPVGQPQIIGSKAQMVFEAADAASYITRAEYSVNGGEWHEVYADDGVADSPRERFTVEVLLPASGEYTVTLRAFDVNSNSGNARQSVKR